MKKEIFPYEEIEKDLQEDFGVLWQSLDADSKKKFVKARQSTLKSRYKTHKDVVTRIGEVRRDQSQLYLGIILGLSGGMMGSVLDKWFGKYWLFDAFVVLFFLGIAITIHKAYQSSVKDIVGFARKN